MSRLRNLGIALEDIKEDKTGEPALEAEVARSAADMSEEVRALEEISDGIEAGNDASAELLDVDGVLQGNGLTETDLKMASVAVEAIRVKLGLTTRSVSTESVRVYVPADITRTIFDTVKRVVAAIIESIKKFCGKIADFFKRRKSADKAIAVMIEKTIKKIEAGNTVASDKFFDENRTAGTTSVYQPSSRLMVHGGISSATVETIIDNLQTVASALDKVNTGSLNVIKDIDGYIPVKADKDDSKRLTPEIASGFIMDLFSPLAEIATETHGDTRFVIADDTYFSVPGIAIYNITANDIRRYSVDMHYVDINTDSISKVDFCSSPQVAINLLKKADKLRSRMDANSEYALKVVAKLENFTQKLRAQLNEKDLDNQVSKELALVNALVGSVTRLMGGFAGSVYSETMSVISHTCSYTCRDRHGNKYQ